MECDHFSCNLLWLEDEVQKWLPVPDAAVRKKAMPEMAGVKTIWSSEVYNARSLALFNAPEHLQVLGRAHLSSFELTERDVEQPIAHSHPVGGDTLLWRVLRWLLVLWGQTSGGEMSLVNSRITKFHYNFFGGQQFTGYLCVKMFYFNTIWQKCQFNAI